MVDRVRDDVHSIRAELEQLDRASADELAHDDDGGRAPGGAVVGDTPERAPGGAEELRQVTVLGVVQRDDRRRPRPGRGDGQRVVEDVELCDVRGDGLRASRGECHGRDPERAAPSDGRILDLDGGQTVGCVFRACRHEHHVVVRSDPPERADELSRVGLGSTEVTGRQRQQ